MFDSEKRRPISNNVQNRLDASSSEGKGEGLRTWTQKLDLEDPIGDRPLLSDELIQAMLGNDPVALLVSIHSMVLTGRVTVDGQAKAHWLSIRCGPEHQMQIARMKAKRNLSFRRD